MPLKGAIVGFGNIAVNGHLPGYRDCRDMTISAVMDVMPEAAEKVRDILPDAAFYTDIEVLLRNADIDFVDIATPPGTHAQGIIKALEHGRHVMCEKPLVLNRQDFIRIADLCNRHNRVVYTVHNWRYAPIYQEASRLLSQGVIGRVRRIDYQVIRTRPSVTAGETGVEDNWRVDPELAGGGILVDHGWHAFYMVNQWVGASPNWVECKLENRKFKDIPIEDTAEAVIGYQDAEVRLFFTWSGDSRSNTVLITGENGTISIDDHTISVNSDHGQQEIPFDQALSQGSHHPEWYAAVIQDFLKELSDPACAGRNLAEAGWCQTMMESCAESNRDRERKTLTHPGINDRDQT